MDFLDTPGTEIRCLRCKTPMCITPTTGRVYGQPIDAPPPRSARESVERLTVVGYHCDACDARLAGIAAEAEAHYEAFKKGGPNLAASGWVEADEE